MYRLLINISQNNIYISSVYIYIYSFFFYKGMTGSKYSVISSYGLASLDFGNTTFLFVCFLLLFTFTNANIVEEGN